MNKLQRWIVVRAGDGCGLTPWDGIDKSYQRVCVSEDVSKLETKIDLYEALIIDSAEASKTVDHYNGTMILRLEATRLLEKKDDN